MKNVQTLQKKISSGSPVCLSSREAVVINQKKNLLFPEKIYCRVSYTTFSSARTFAVTLKDNGVVTIIGEPTGGKPCFYGMPKKDLTPNFKICFRVSRALFYGTVIKHHSDMGIGNCII